MHVLYIRDVRNDVSERVRLSEDADSQDQALQFAERLPRLVRRRQDNVRSSQNTSLFIFIHRVQI